MTRPRQGPLAELEQTGSIEGRPLAGALDLGSNAIRFAIGGRKKGRPTLLEAGRYPIRLGKEVFSGGTLSRETIGAVAAAAADFRLRLEQLEIPRYRAVATSALRECRNSGDVVAALREEAGIELEIIDGEEEARLVFTSVAANLSLDRPALLADLGGGSLELSRVTSTGMSDTISFPLGTVRLMAELGDDLENEERVRARFGAVVSLPPLPAGAAPPDRLILTGGNADAVADLADPAQAITGTSVLTPGDVRRVLDLVAPMPVPERISRLGLRPDRADVIVAAGLVYLRIAEMSGITELVAPRVGVQHGLIAELLAQDTTAGGSPDAEYSHTLSAGG